MERIAILCDQMRHVKNPRLKVFNILFFIPNIIQADFFTYNFPFYGY